MAPEPAPRVLIVSTTPGPSRALAAAARAMHGRASIQVLSSTDPRFGRGGDVYRDFGIEALSVEAVLPAYQPMAVTHEQAIELLHRLQPDILLAGAVNEPTGELHPLEDVLCGSATSIGMRNAQFIEGWDVWHPRRWGPPRAGTYLAIDEHAAEVLRSGGVPAARIAVVGYSPSLMTPDRIDLDQRRQIRAALGIGDGCRLIVYFGQVNCRNGITLGWTARALAPQDRLVLQRHPRDTRPLEELLTDCPHGSVIVSDLSSTRMLHAADVCVTHFSLMSFTAAGLGVPSILTLLPDDVTRIRNVCGQYPTTRLGGTVECHDFDGLCQALAEPRYPSHDFVERVRSATTSFTENIAMSLLGSLVHAAQPRLKEDERTSLGY